MSLFDTYYELPSCVWSLLTYVESEFNIKITESDVLIDAAEILKHERDSNIHLGNMLAGQVFKELSEKLCEKYGVTCTYYINCLDTHFYVNGEEVYDGEDIKNIIRDFNNEVD